MRLLLTYIGVGLTILAVAIAQNEQSDSVVSCQDPTITSTVLVDETITRVATTTIGLLPDVTSIVSETTTLTVTEEPACAFPNNKRDEEPTPASSTQSSLYYHWRNPHIAPRPTSIPTCAGPSSTTLLTSTLITLLELMRTTSLPTPTALTITSTSTSTITTTTTATSNPCPTLPATNSQTDYTTNYTLYARTCGRTLSYSNPGNTNPPVTLPIRAKVLACEAAAQCATAALNQGAGYLSFDLHYRFASGWECVMFYGRNRRAEFWDVVDEGVGEGYGYST